MKKGNIKNTLMYTLLCAFTGALIAAVVWAFMKLMGLGIEFVWEWIPERIGFKFYPLVVCLIGGVVLGLYKGKFGDYPENLETVMGKVKRDKFYPYHNVHWICIAAIIPLIFGGSIGPEAGLTGVIAGLMYWAGAKMRYARERVAEFAETGISATLGVIFGAPLFGIAAPIEQKVDKDKETVVPKASKMISIIVAVIAAFGMFALLSHLFGALEGIPRVEAPDITNTERIFSVPLALAGAVFGYLFLASEKLAHAVFSRLKGKTPIIVSTVLGGLILGLIGTYMPLAMFSGEEQMGELALIYKDMAPWLLIAVGAVKLVLTNICICSGWSGGHFFPVIFAGISIGYGFALLTGLNVAFCLAVITAGLLGVVMRKPVAVSLLLLLCFPIRVIPWLIVAAVIGSILPLGKLKQK